MSYEHFLKQSDLEYIDAMLKNGIDVKAILDDLCFNAYNAGLKDGEELDADNRAEAFSRNRDF